MPGDEAGERDQAGAGKDPGEEAAGTQARDTEAAAHDKHEEGTEARPGDAQRESRCPALLGRSGARALAIDGSGTGAR